MLDWRASDLMAYCLINKATMVDKQMVLFVQDARLRKINATLYDTCARNSFSTHDIIHLREIGNLRSPFSTWIEHKESYNILREYLKFEFWPVSRKKAASHWPFVIIIIYVVEIRWVRETAVFVTGTTWTGRSRRMDWMNAATRRTENNANLNRGCRKT